MAPLRSVGGRTILERNRASGATRSRGLCPLGTTPCRFVGYKSTSLQTRLQLCTKPYLIASLIAVGPPVSIKRLKNASGSSSARRPRHCSSTRSAVSGPGGTPSHARHCVATSGAICGRSLARHLPRQARRRVGRPADLGRVPHVDGLAQPLAAALPGPPEDHRRGVVARGALDLAGQPHALGLAVDLHGLPLANLESTGLAQNLGPLEGSYRDFQSNSWVKLRILGQPCAFYLAVRSADDRRRAVARRGLPLGLAEGGTVILAENDRDGSKISL